MRNLLGRLRRSGSRSLVEQLATLTSVGDGSTLTLDFTTGVLDQRLTFTRSSTATYIGADGLVKTMAAAPTNDPTKARFDHNPTTLAPRGLLIEGQATNYATALDTPWGRQNINGSGVGGALAYGQTGADGASNTAARLTTAAATTFTNMFVTLSTNAAGAPRTFSVWLRGVGSNTTASFSINGSSTPTGVTSSQIGSPVTLTTSTSGNNLLALVTGLSTTAWTRVSISRTDAQASSDSYRICPGDHNGTINSNLSVDVYVPQVESGIGMSSTIPTGASQVTRNQDQVQMTDLASIGFNTSAGTLTINGTYNKDANSAAYPRSIRFMGTSVQSMAMITSGKTLFGNTPNTSGGSYFEASRTLASAGAFKFGWTLTTAANPALANATVSLNGSSTSITPLGQGDIVNPISLDFLYPSGSALNFPSMNISSLKYWPYATTAADLNVRTSL